VRANGKKKIFPQVPAILLCQEYDDEASILKVPSTSPPRRLSRSSIDLRDLEAQHERDKIMSQNVSESVSSIYHCFDNQMLRYSGSEPINAHIKAALENQFSMKCANQEDGESEKQQQSEQQQQQQHQRQESKSSVNNFSFMNNFEHSETTTTTTTKEHDMNLISSASIIKDNQVNANGCNKSDSDFFSLLRYNSEKLRRMNCFSSFGTNNSNGNKPKKMIYALSDKTLHLNNERKMQAIVNKSDIFNYLNKSFDHKNLLDNNFVAQHNQKVGEGKKPFDNSDFINVDMLKRVFEEKIVDAEMVAALVGGDDALAEAVAAAVAADGSKEKLQKKETVSLPPIGNSNSNEIVKLNNSRSIDTVLLNIKNNTDKMYTFKLLYDFSPKTINQEETLTKNLLKDDSAGITDVPINGSGGGGGGGGNGGGNGLPSAPTNNNNLVVLESLSGILKPVNLSDGSVSGPQDMSMESSSNIKCCDTMNPAYLDDKSIGKRKRTPSNVTYNVNVIDFQTEDESDAYHTGLGSGVGGSGGNGGGRGDYGKRSNSSTSKSFSSSSLLMCSKFAFLPAPLFPLLFLYLLFLYLSHSLLLLSFGWSSYFFFFFSLLQAF
jgi:hypothetical protein